MGDALWDKNRMRMVDRASDSWVDLPLSSGSGGEFTRWLSRQVMCYGVVPTIASVFICAGHEEPDPEAEAQAPLHQSPRQ